MRRLLFFLHNVVVHPIAGWLWLLGFDRIAEELHKMGAPEESSLGVETHMSPRTYFISGHLDITPEEFSEHYVERLLALIDEGASFVVGDARGADKRAQTFLKGRGAMRVTVYHMYNKPRNNEGFQTHGGFRTDEERDRAMTAASDADVAWVRPGRENSGTAKNLGRRFQQR